MSQLAMEVVATTCEVFPHGGLNCFPFQWEPCFSKRGSGGGGVIFNLEKRRRHSMSSIVFNTIKTIFFYWYFPRIMIRIDFALSGMVVLEPDSRLDSSSNDRVFFSY